MNRKGISMILPLALLTALGVSLGVFMTLHKIRAKQIGSAWDKTVALEAAKSSFYVLESALKRRLWEAPAGPDCLRMFDFGVTFKSPEGVAIEIKATLDPTINMIRMEAHARYRNLHVEFLKTAKVLDAANFLVASASTTTATIEQPYAMKEPVGLIGKDRRIYFEGPVELSTNVPIPTPSACGVTTAFQSPKEISILIQAERISMLAGMGYVMKQHNSARSDHAMAACINSYTPAAKKFNFTKGSGGALLTADSRTAAAIQGEVRVPGSQPVCPSSAPDCFPAYAALIKSVYPRALFCGTTPPHAAQGALDDGCFTSPTQSYGMTYVAVSNSPDYGDFTCYSDFNIPEGIRKLCSNSEHFPKGFSAWRSAAGLDGILYTTDGEPLELPTIDWDNLAALEEDAAQCGHVVSTSSSSFNDQYEDCDLSDRNLLDAYVANPGVNPCTQYRTLDLDALTGRFPHYDENVYKDSTQRDRFLRRVVYSKVPVVLAQKDARGVLMGLPEEARQNLPVWFVSESEFLVQPHQPNLTPWAVGEPLRKLYFNQDSDLVRKTPSINAVILSPEQLVVISPRHVPFTYAQMQSRLPVVSGKIKPTYHIINDWEHQENDGFLYGFRDVNISNILLISSTTSAGYDDGIFLRGLWGSTASSSVPWFINACMMDNPSDLTGRGIYETSIPSGYDQPWAPPPSSSFYRFGNKTGGYNVAGVFSQQSAFNGHSSHILFNGVRGILKFDSTVPAGKRNLSVALRRHGDTFPADMSDRRVKIDGTTAVALGWMTVPAPPAPAPCQGSTGTTEGITVAGSPFGTFIPLNHSVAASFSHSAPEVTFGKVGAIFAQELPVIQVSD